MEEESGNIIATTDTQSSIYTLVKERLAPPSIKSPPPIRRFNGPTTAINSKQRRSRVAAAIAFGAVLLIITGASYYITKSKQQQQHSIDASPSSSSTVKPTQSTTPSTPNPPSETPNRRLFGYYGQNAIGDGPGGSFTITFGAFNTSDYGGTYFYRGDGREANPPAVVSAFQALGKDIAFCQSLSIKVLMSMGGDKISNYQWITGDGVLLATTFFNMFLEGKGTVRPFGAGIILDGFELDVEKNLNPVVWNAEMIDFITTMKKLSPKSQIAVVPQCFLGGGKDANVGDVIAAVPKLIDYILVQYYNNPVCSYPNGFDFNAWKALFGGPIVVGLAGDWSSAISGGFLEPGALQEVYNMVKNDAQFGGFAVYDVSSSNPPASSQNPKNMLNPPLSEYSKTLRNVLDGVLVGSGFPSQESLLKTKHSANRCGGTWIHADSTCLKPCDPYAPACGVNQQCFMFLSNCI
ncbi:UNVERIFIED_CONTAM: hypothetical protein HDU68_010263 [Siphonaria sp. JEL0065]|nr:hypothetical protein HDU68_010263 [Siphonaria sp. JEL0065]